jgi:hypothetical protein
VPITLQRRPPLRRRRRFPSRSVTPAATLTLTTPVAHQLHQRDGLGAGAGYADVTITGTYTGSPSGAIEASSGGAYSTIVASPSGGTFAGKLRLEVGNYTLAVRFAGDTGVNDSAANVKVGSKWVVSGQSNSLNRLTNPQTYTGTANHASKYGASSGWGVMAEPVEDSGSGGSFWPLFASHVVTDGGVPCAIVPGPGVGGTSITTWLPAVDPFDTGTNFGLMLTRALESSGEDGCEGLVWLLGETDAGAAMSQATFYGHLSTFLDAWWYWTRKPVLLGLLGANLTGSGPINLAIVQAVAQRRGAAAYWTPPDYDNSPHWEGDTEAGQIADAMWDAAEPLLYEAAAAGGGASRLIGPSALIG